MISDIVSTDQVGYRKARRASTVLRLIDDVTGQLSVEEEPGLLVAIDYSQTFDHILNDFMLKVSGKFGFGPDFVKLVHVLIKIISRVTVTIVDGYLIILK